MMRNLLFSLLLFSTSMAFACHQTTVAEISSTDNNNGTFTYELQVCMGSEDTWGFDLDFTGADVVSVLTASITDPTTGTSISPTFPATSSSADLEFGDFDGTSGTVFHAATTGQACFVIEVVLDGPATNVDLNNTEFAYGPCSNSTTLTSCFPSTANYTVSLTSDLCAGNNISFDFFDAGGNSIAGVSNVPTDGATRSWILCDLCAASFQMNAPATTGGNPADRCEAGLSGTDDGAGSYIVTDGTGTPIINSSMSAPSTGSETNPAPCIPPILNANAILVDLEKVETSTFLSWKIESEAADVYYVVERSADGVHFENIQEIDKDRNQETVLAVYGFIDEEPFSGDNYYRIKMMDQTANVWVYSVIKHIHFENKGAEKEGLFLHNIYPQPVHDLLQLTYESSTETEVSIEIYNSLGQLLRTKELQIAEGLHTYSLNVTDLAEGSYYISLSEGNQRISRRFVKVN